MQRIAEQDERGVRRAGFGGSEAGDPAAVRLAADDDPRLARHHRVEGRDRVFRPAFGQVDRRGGDAAGLESVDIRCHAGGRPRGSVPQKTAEFHPKSVAVR